MATSFEQKWGDDPFTAKGYAQVPDALFEYGVKIGLSAEELWLLVCIIRYKHTTDDPYPSQELLATISGNSLRTIQRLVGRMRKKGLVATEKVKNRSGLYAHLVYDFRPLRAALNKQYESEQSSAQHQQVADKPKNGHPPKMAGGSQPPVKFGATTRQIRQEHPPKRVQPPVQLAAESDSYKQSLKNRESESLSIDESVPENAEERSAVRCLVASELLTADSALESLNSEQLGQLRRNAEDVAAREHRETLELVAFNSVARDNLINAVMRRLAKDFVVEIKRQEYL